MRRFPPAHVACPQLPPGTERPARGYFCFRVWFSDGYLFCTLQSLTLKLSDHCHIIGEPLSDCFPPENEDDTRPIYHSMSQQVQGA